MQMTWHRRREGRDEWQASYSALRAEVHGYRRDEWTWGIELVDGVWLADGLTETREEAMAEAEAFIFRHLSALGRTAWQEAKREGRRA